MGCRSQKDTITAGRPEYVGGQTCVRCHASEAEAWRASDHALAMQVADELSLPSDLRDSLVTVFDETFDFHRRGKRLFVAVTSKGSSPREFEIKFAFGVRPLQQYLVAFAKGRLQCLPVAWDTRRKRWFNLSPDSALASDDWFHWSRDGQNWNAQCADCHSTGLRRNYAPEEDAFHTTFREMNVNCEACHGPGSRHLSWAGQNPRSLRKPVGPKGEGYAELVAPLLGESNRRQIETCAPCHSRRTPLQSDLSASRNFLDNYAPDLIRPGLYHPDGHFLDEDYEYGSFLQSKMFRNGGKCSDCHEPHGLKIRMRGNALCAQCHKPETFDTPSHHRHSQGTPGGSCVECHMPGKLYMRVDFRRDHSMRLPRPDLSVKFGTPNACNDCHRDKKPEWAAEWIAKWFGPVRKPHFAEAFALGWAHGFGGDSALAAVAVDTLYNPIVRASALEALGGYFSQSAVAAKIRTVTDSDELVRLASARSLEEDAREIRLAVLPRLLNDSIRAVRLAATNSLLDLGAALAPRDQPAFRRELAEQENQFTANAYYPSSHFNAALFHAKLGNTLEARQAYLKCLELDDRFIPAHMNLAQLLAGQGEIRQAEWHLRKVIRLQPGFGEAYYSLGLVLAERGLLDSATIYLRQASILMPRRARVRYNLGLCLQKLGRSGAAEKMFLEAIRLEPNVPDFQYALAVLNAQTRQKEKIMGKAPDR